jgi:hypothetical protein
VTRRNISFGYYIVVVAEEAEVEASCASVAESNRGILEPPDVKRFDYPFDIA